ncbi:uncharacterized protein LOC131639895 [Vicia villosa]|uniref:uncharacterized protein LOC131639895 n=1 Tax=Vicia villosa TaxID=3911 RepID=UPI00273B2F2F|nr:uncharacterized protein LOC131639895 [Vicia villosa]
MIIETFNIRGGGSYIKRKRISGIIRKGQEDVFLLQETKLEDVPELVAKIFWGIDEIEFSFFASDTISVISSFQVSGYLGVEVVWKGGLYYIVNIYSACSIALTRELWKELLLLLGKFNDGEWIIAGDFNALKSTNERVGSSSDNNARQRKEFENFIDNSGLVDVPCKGKKYTWFGGDGMSKSIIDRFLVSESIISLWGAVGQLIGLRDISDHFLVWLEVDREDWGPKPFKFNNEWFSNKDFVPFVEKEWNLMEVRGRGDFVLKEKIRLIKDRLRWWSKMVFSKYDLEVDEGVRDMNETYDLETVDAESLALNKEASKRIWMNLKIKENMLIQKAILNWLNDGDSNSRFFHRSLKERRRRNHISSIVSNSGIVNSVKEVKEEVKKHFEGKFVENCVNIPILEGMEFNNLSMEDRNMFKKPFTENEIKEAVRSCESSKILGLDGMSLLFSKIVGPSFKRMCLLVLRIFTPERYCQNRLLHCF